MHYRQDKDVGVPSATAWVEDFSSKKYASSTVNNRELGTQIKFDWLFDTIVK